VKSTHFATQAPQARKVNNRRGAKRNRRQDIAQMQDSHGGLPLHASIWDSTRRLFTLRASSAYMLSRTKVTSQMVHGPRAAAHRVFAAGILFSKWDCR